MPEPTKISPVFETSHQMGEKTPMFAIVLLLGSFPLFGAALLVLSICCIYLSIIKGDIYEAVRLFIYGIGSSVFLLALGWAFIMWGMVRYRFEDEGLSIKFPFHSWYTVSWDDFQQVCIIHGSSAQRGEHRPCPAICCVMKGEKTNLFGRWKSENPFKYRKVFTIVYTPELHEGIKEKCPYEVVDLRDTPNYWTK